MYLKYMRNYMIHFYRMTLDLIKKLHWTLSSSASKKLVPPTRGQIVTTVCVQLEGLTRNQTNVTVQLFQCMYRAFLLSCKITNKSTITINL